jgi:tetratricopeptide (TPR) repeat protein
MVQQHLRVFEKEGRVEIWVDTNMAPGDEYRREIAQELNSCAAAILLISTDFLASDFIRDIELPALIERHRRKQIAIFPLIVEDCAWKHVPEIEKLNVWPPGGRSLASRRTNNERAHVLTEFLSNVLLQGKRHSGAPAKVDTTTERARVLDIYPLRASRPPHPPADFCGRKKELEELEAAVREERNVIGIWGEPGFGKTALALAFTQKARAIFSASIFFKGTASAPLTPDSVLRRIVAAFGLPGSHITNPNGIADTTLERSMDRENLLDRYMEELERQRVVIVLDNVRDPGDLESLVPPAGSLLLITARKPFLLTGIQLIQLSHLLPNDAAHLLRSVSPRCAGYEEAIANKWGLSPLAVRIAGGVVLMHPEERVEDAVLKPTHPSTNLAEVSYALLDGEQRAAWCSLSCFQRSFDVSAAAAIWRLSEEAGRDLLQEFVRYGLVEFAPDVDRYRFHDVLRRFAETKQSPVDRDARLGDLSRFYAERAQGFAPLLTSGDRELEKIEAEYENLMDVIARRKHSDPAHAMCGIRIAAALFWYWNFTGQFEEGIRLLRSLIAQVARTAPELDVARARYGLGGLLFMQGEFAAAQPHLQQALRAAMRVGEHRLAGLILIVLGMVALEGPESTHMPEKAFRESRELLEQSIALLEGVGDTWSLALAYNDLARVIARWRNVLEAEEWFERSLAAWTDVDDSWGRALTLNAWGVAAEQESQRLMTIPGHDVQCERQRENALRLLSEALTIQRELRDKWGVAGSQLHLGKIYTWKHQVAAALPALFESLVLMRQLGRRAQLSLCIRAIAELAEEMDAAVDADFFYEVANAVGRNQAGVRSSEKGMTVVEWLERKATELRIDLMPSVQAIGSTKPPNCG